MDRMHTFAGEDFIPYPKTGVLVSTLLISIAFTVNLIVTGDAGNYQNPGGIIASIGVFGLFGSVLSLSKEQQETIFGVGLIIMTIVALSTNLENDLLMLLSKRLLNSVLVLVILLGPIVVYHSFIDWYLGEKTPEEQIL